MSEALVRTSGSLLYEFVSRSITNGSVLAIPFFGGRIIGHIQKEIMEKAPYSTETFRLQKLIRVVFLVSSILFTFVGIDSISNNIIAPLAASGIQVAVLMTNNPATRLLFFYGPFYVGFIKYSSFQRP